MAKPKQQKPKFDIGDLLGFLSDPRVKTVTNAAQGKVNPQDVAQMLGGVQSKSAPYAGVLSDAVNQKLRNDYATAKGIGDFWLPLTEGEKLVKGKSTVDDPLWAALGFFPFGKVAKKVKNTDRGVKMLLDTLRSSKPLRSQTSGSFSGSTDTTYSPIELLLLQLQGE